MVSAMIPGRREVAALGLRRIVVVALDVAMYALASFGCAYLITHC